MMLHKHRNIILLGLGLGLAWWLSRFAPFHDLLQNIAELHILGALIGGLLLSITFTFSTAALILIAMTDTLSPVTVAFVGAIGSAVSDLLIYLSVRSEIQQNKHFTKPHHFKSILSSKYFHWTLPVLGAVIVASPLPDEFGITLMSVAHLKAWQFAIIVYFLDVACIFALIEAAKLIVH